MGKFRKNFGASLIVALTLFTTILISTSSAVAGPADGVCTAPVVNSHCCYYTLRDQFSNIDVHYRAPSDFFPSETKAKDFAALQAARMPFQLPYNEDVKLVTGWFYEDGGHHSASDFWRTNVSAGQDVSFQVRAAAAGKVVTVLWDNWFGNTVIIEHVASSGAKYRTIYMHLRNGGMADLNKAKAVVAPDPTKVDNWTKYVKYAAKGYNVNYWGTAQQTLKVSVGQNVSEGQLIAFAGNTGAGGAGNGLNPDGTPSDSIRANNHLHFMLAVPAPGNSNDWTYLDAFGVYEKASTACYDITKKPSYARFFAPFFPSFHNIETQRVVDYFSYYPNMGMGLQTLSTYFIDGKDYAAGAFAPQVGSEWFAQINMDRDAFSKNFASYDAKGYRPRQISASTDSSGKAYFSAIWQKKGNVSHYLYFDMSEADFNAKWKDLVTTKGYRLDDYAAYFVGSEMKHAATFVKDGGGFYFFRNMTAAEYQVKFNEYAAKKFYPTSIAAVDTASGPRYAGVWRPVTGSWVTYINMSPADYQTKFNSLAGQGYRLYKIQGYKNGTLIGAIWTK